MQKTDYEKLRQLDTAPILELEEQLAEKVRREQETKEREEKKGKAKKKKKRGRS